MAYAPAWYAVKVAKSQVGYCEKASNSNLDSKTANAGYANWTKYARDIHDACRKAGKPNLASEIDFGAAWCDCFFDWVVLKACKGDVTKAAGMLCGKFDDYTVNSADMYRICGRWYREPKVGDQIFFKSASGGICHTGIVINVANGYVYTVEGNTSNALGVVANGGCVAQKSYRLDYERIAGYGRPRYDEPEFAPGKYVATATKRLYHSHSVNSDVIGKKLKGRPCKVSKTVLSKGGLTWGYLKGKGWMVMANKERGKKYVKPFGK